MKVTRETVKQTQVNAEAAFKNEMLTRQRVERLEMLLANRTLFGRLRWLIFGR